MSVTADHPLCAWLEKIHDTHARSGFVPTRLRVQAEQVLLHRHQTGQTGLWCRYDGESFPCLEWRVIAAGWAHRPGYDPVWTPGSERTLLDLDVLLAELDR